MPNILDSKCGTLYKSCGRWLIPHVVSTWDRRTETPKRFNIQRPSANEPHSIWCLMVKMLVHNIAQIRFSATVCVFVCVSYVVWSETWKFNVVRVILGATSTHVGWTHIFYRGRLDRKVYLASFWLPCVMLARGTHKSVGQRCVAG